MAHSSPLRFGAGVSWQPAVKRESCVQSSISGERVPVVGLMRFSVVLESAVAGHWRLTKGRSFRKIVREVLRSKRLSARLRLAAHMPLASLANQTDPDFQLCVLYSALIPPLHRSALTDLAQQHSFIQLVEVPTTADLRQVCSNLIPQSTPCITFRLDDDDAVGPQFIADLRAMAKPENEGRVLSFRNGIQMERRGRKLAFQEVEYLNNAFGLSYFDRTGHTIFDQGGHHDIDPAKIVAHPRRRAWIRAIHAASDSASRFKPDRLAWETLPSSASEQMPEYGSIDFTKVAPDLAPFDWWWATKRRVRWKLQQLAALLGIGRRDYDAPVEGL
jgi:hypothetical protein